MYISLQAASEATGGKEEARQLFTDARAGRSRNQQRARRA